MIWRGNVLESAAGERLAVVTGTTDATGANDVAGAAGATDAATTVGVGDPAGDAGSAHLRGAAGDGDDCSGDVLRFGEHVLRFTSVDPTHLRAVSETGEVFSLRKRSWTVARYEANCGGRVYAADRRGIRGRREVRDAAGTIIAVTAPRANGDLALDVRGELTLDVVCISWALTYVDANARRTLY